MDRLPVYPPMYRAWFSLLRRMAARLLVGVLVCLLAPGCAQAADIGITPVAVHFDQTTQRAMMQVVNNGSEPVILQAEAIAWRRVDGVDVDAPTGDLLVNPPVFTVQPGQTQVVRVGLRRPGKADEESTYRMVLREVPGLGGAGRGGVSGTVQVLVALRVPVYVSPTQVVREARWRASRDGQGQIVASVSNAGNVHMKVGRLRLRGGTPDEAPVMSEQTVGAVLFPGEERSFRLAADRVPADRPLMLEVLTDRGIQHVALDLPKD